MPGVHSRAATSTAARPPSRGAVSSTTRNQEWACRADSRRPNKVVPRTHPPLCALRRSGGGFSLRGCGALWHGRTRRRIRADEAGQGLANERGNRDGNHRRPQGHRGRGGQGHQGGDGPRRTRPDSRHRHRQEGLAHGTAPPDGQALAGGAPAGGQARQRGARPRGGRPRAPSPRARACGPRGAHRRRLGRRDAAGPRAQRGLRTPHLPDHRGDGADLLRHGLHRGGRPLHRDELLQLHRAQRPARPPQQKRPRHLLRRGQQPRLACSLRGARQRRV